MIGFRLGGVIALLAYDVCVYTRTSNVSTYLLNHAHT